MERPFDFAGWRKAVSGGKPITIKRENMLKVLEWIEFLEAQLAQKPKP